MHGCVSRRVGQALKPKVRRSTIFAAAVAVAAMLAGCAQVEIPPYLRPLSKDTMMLLGKKGMTTATPMYVRIFKEESELELWKQRDDGRFYHFKTYPICNWSGALGPKTKQGDMQAPEGFYRVPQHQMNPNSQYHLAFNLGFPNAFDRTHGRSGSYLMVHGGCSSVGCYAMTDPAIDDIYRLASAALTAGQPGFQVHAVTFAERIKPVGAHGVFTSCHLQCIDHA